MAKLRKIRTKLEITSKRKSLLLLEGEYLSSLKGKSLDFDDLREYSYGDDVRDIDWRASAKQSTPLVKRYIANRRHNILFVVDTSLPMVATAPDFSPKYEIANGVIGVLGSIAVAHNDNVALVYSKGEQITRFPYRGDEKHLNRIVETVEANTEESRNMVDVAALISKAHLSSNSQTIMVVITGNFVPTDEMKTLVRKVQHRHDLLWITVPDINPVTVPKTKNVLDILDIVEIPESLRGNNSLAEEMWDDIKQREDALSAFLTSLRVSHANIGSMDQVIPSLLTLLKRREHVHR